LDRISLGLDALANHIRYRDSSHTQHGQHGASVRRRPDIFPGLLHDHEELLLVGCPGLVLSEHPLEV